MADRRPEDRLELQLHARAAERHASSTSWGYKEWPKDHSVYRYWKIEAALTVISCKLELAFGARAAQGQGPGVRGAERRPEGDRQREANPDAVGLAASVSAALAPAVGGEIGVRGGLGDWIEVIGKVNAGFEGSDQDGAVASSGPSRSRLCAGKGTFIARSKLGLSYEGKATLWESAPSCRGRSSADGSNPPVYYLNVSVRGYRAEVFVNGAPILPPRLEARLHRDPLGQRVDDRGAQRDLGRVAARAPVATTTRRSPQRLIVQLLRGRARRDGRAGQEQVLCKLRHSPAQDLGPRPPARLLVTHDLAQWPRWA